MTNLHVEIIKKHSSRNNAMGIIPETKLHLNNWLTNNNNNNFHNTTTHLQ